MGWAALVAVALYALGSLVALPWLLDRAADGYAGSGPERNASVASIFVDPLSADVILQGVEVSDLSSGASLSAGLVRLDFSAASLLERRPVLDLIVIERATLRGEALELAALLREAVLPRVPRVERLELRAGSFESVDPTGSVRSETTLRDISVTATGLDLRVQEGAQVDAGRYTLHAATAGGGQIDLEGTLFTGLQSARGRVDVRNLDLVGIRPWLGERLERLEPRGVVNWSGEYSLTSLMTMPSLEVFNGRAELTDFAFNPVPELVVRASRLRGTVDGMLDRAQGTINQQGRVEILDAPLEIVNTRLVPPDSFRLSEVSATLAIDPGAQLPTIDVHGRLGDRGRASMTMGASAEDLAIVSIQVMDIPAAMLSRYAQQSIGRALDGGRADIELNYVRGAEGAEGNLRAVTRDLSLSAVDPETGDQSLEMAAALLEDTQGVIQIDVPFTARTSSVEDAVVGALEARLTALSAAPFAELGAIVDRDADALRAVPFDAGAAGLSADALDTIDGLAAALHERPRLRVRMPQGFDPIVDRDALAQQQIELHVLLATAGPTAQQRRPQSVDFSSARVQDVLNEFGNERLAAEQLESIRTRFDCGSDVPCSSEYYAAVFDALVANEAIPDAALSRLGRFRTQSVTNALTERGIEPERVDPATDAAAANGPSYPTIPVEMRVSQRE